LNYTPEILDQQEFESRYKNFWMKLEPGDFYFDGTVKTGKQDLFTTGDLARFILIKTADGKFQIISI
jgi:aminopeptidase C